MMTDRKSEIPTSTQPVPTFISVDGREIGEGCQCFIIAEAGVNHNGSLETAKQLVDVAVEAEVDAVKFQSFEADRLATEDAPKADYQTAATGCDESQLEMLRRLELNFDEQRALKAYCLERDILFLSTPFDENSAATLVDEGMPAIKIPSGELTNSGFLRICASYHLPMIISSGMATLEEVGHALDVVYKAGATDIVLLHCVSDYPADPHDVNLRAMATMSAEFGCPVGFSDHTMGIEVPLAAVALGACVVEKHFTLNRSSEGPDHSASLEPEELKAMVRGIKTVEAAMGHGRKEPVASETSTAIAVRRSLVARQNIVAGSIISAEMLMARRPGAGISPTEIDKVVDRKVTKDILKGALVSWESLR
jgi:N,N'-diacetyllegionaminate synthase